MVNTNYNDHYHENIQNAKYFQLTPSSLLMTFMQFLWNAKLDSATITSPRKTTQIFSNHLATISDWSKFTNICSNNPSQRAEERKQTTNERNSLLQFDNTHVVPSSARYP